MIIRKTLKLLGVLFISAFIICIIAPADTVNAESQPIKVGAEYAVGDTIQIETPVWIWRDKPANYYLEISADLGLSSISYTGGYFTHWSASFKYDDIYLPVYMADENTAPAVALRVKSGNGTKDDPYEFEVIHAYKVTVNSAENGVVTADKTQARAGESVELTVTPDNHYELDTLTVNGGGSTITPEQSPSDPSSYSFTMPSGNVTVSATFKEVRTVEFDKNCSDEVTGMPESISVTKNDEGKFICDEPGETPVRKGYSFGGWYSDSGLTQKFDFTGEVEADTTLYAKWDGNVVLTFDPNGGTINGSTSPVKMMCAPGDEVTIPEAPTRSGYEFLYWEGSQYDPGDKYTVTAEDHTFTASWKKDSSAEDADENSGAPDPDNNNNDSGADDSSTKKNKGVKTGDSAHLLGWLMLAIAAETGVVYVYRKRRNS